jgi:hypothetical protein
VKSNLLVGLVAGIAVCASSVSAQVCQGDLSFRSRSKHVGGAIALGENSTSFGAGLSAGHALGWFGGASVAMVDFDGVNSNAVAVNGGLGYSMPLAKRSKWQVCPGGTLSLGFGPSFDTGAGTQRMSSQTVTMGASFGTSLAMNKTVHLLPFGSAAFGHTRATLNSNSVDDNYLLLGAGAGIQFSPSLVFRPSLTLASGADLVDDTIFSLGLTWALPR